MKTILRLTWVALLLGVARLSAATLYVSQSSINPTPPFSTWATAATNIQDAVEAAPLGALVLVTNGVYAGGVVVGKPLVLMSVNGARFTAIDGGGTNRCLSLTNGTWLWGFTFTNGSADTGGGVRGSQTNCFLTNCVVTGNSADTGAGVYGVTLYNSLLTRNTARGNGSGGGGASSTLYNSTVSGNSAAQGGGVFQGTLYNCIVYDNSAPSEPNYSSSTLNYCCTMPLPASGSGNFNNAPLFVSEAAGDFRLQVGSPCIDAGNSAYAAAFNLTDLSGNPRTAGGRVDVGAYEYSGAGSGSGGGYVMNFQFSGFAPSNGNPAPTDPVIGSLSWQAASINDPIQMFDSISLTLDGHTYTPGELHYTFEQNPGSPMSAIYSDPLQPVVDNLTDGFYLVWDHVSLQPFDFAYASSRRSGIWDVNIVQNPSSFSLFSISSRTEPVIAVQPQSQTVVAGTNVSFSVTASGAVPLSWQWWFNQTVIRDATNSALTLNAVTTNQAGSYYVVITNILGAVTSQVAVLAVLSSPPQITLQPVSQQASIGDSITFIANAIGSLPLHWQWWSNNAAIPAATNSTLKLTVVATNQAAGYFVVVTNSLGSVTSQVALLTVPGLAPQITTQPISQGVSVGDNVTFTARAVGSLPLYWQWQFNRVPIPFAILSNLTVTAVTLNQAGVYSVIVSNAFGSVTSTEATLTVRQAGAKYVWQNSPTPSVPYDTWATAAHSIQDAVDATSVGVIVVTNGTYIGGLWVNKPLMVRSVNGPRSTIIDGGGTNQCVGLASGAIFSGFTLTHGVGGGSGSSPTSIFTNCVIASNSGNYGGGAWSCTLYNCTLAGNSASWNGGGAWNCTLYNCLLVGNSATNFGGGSDTCTLHNCTLSGNSARNNGGGVSGCTLYNCISFFNVAAVGANYDEASILDHCCTTPLPSGHYNNLSLDPQLTDGSHLSADSPCRGAGSSAYATGSDLDGDGWENPPDIGCDQYRSGPITGSLTVSLMAAYTNVSVGFPVSFTGVIAGRAALSVWDFGDGTVVRNQPSTNHAWVQPGDYLVTLTAFNDSNPGGVRATVAMHIAAQQVLYVTTTSVNPQPPYASWSTAARKIQDAVDAAALPGMLVLVSNGVYLGGIAINTPLTLQSVNGPQFTMIDGSRGMPCVRLTNDSMLSGFTLTNGIGGFDAGGVYCTGLNASLTNCIIVGNWGGASGGTLYDCTLSGNWGEDGGGAVYCSLYNCLLSSNAAYAGNGMGGGAAWCDLYHCTLTANVATNGGGAYMSVLRDCILSGNKGFTAAAQCTLYNCALTENERGGASDSTLYNCTLTGNASGGAFNSTLYNSIVYYNPVREMANYDGFSTLNYCCTTPMPTNGVGNITNEPALSGSWRISSNSPCRAAGSAAYTSEVDLDGEPWLNPPSLGCDEFYTTSQTGALSVTIAASWTNVATGFVVILDGAISGRASDSRWEFGDETIESNRLHTSYQWLKPGNYNLVLRAYNNDHPSGVTAITAIRVVERPVHYVDINNTRASPPYTNWTTAANNIQAAIDAVPVPGALVLVSNGVYTTGSYTNGSQWFGALGLCRVVVDKPLTVQSVNGPSTTVIQGNQIPGTTNGSAGIRCVYLTSGATLSSFALAAGGAMDGWWSYGGGVYCESSSAVVTNCILTSNSAGYGGGAYSGTLYNCFLGGNSASEGGGAHSANLNGCVVSNNFAMWGGGGALACTLYNCTVANNGSGTAVADCTLYNCILYSNGWNYDDSSTLNYCCTTPMPASGVGNITNAPLFVDQANGDFRLQLTSPCINAGNNAYRVGATDLDGNLRIIGGTLDMGAYEYQTVVGSAFYAWLQSYGLPTDGSADYADADGDGLNNYQEWVSGTNPTNALSVLRLLSATPTGSNATVSWQSVAGINYFLERSANLGSPFTIEATNIIGLRSNIVLIATNSVVVGTNIVGQAGTTTYPDTNATGAGPFFYRVGVQGP